MQIAIVGGGKIGFALAKQLQTESHEIILIDTKDKVIEQASGILDVMGYVGNGASYSVLKEAGVEHCELLIAVTATDEVNMLSCLVAHRLMKKGHTIARVRNPEYVSHLYALREDLGLSMSINPERAAAEEIARILRFPSATHVELFAGGRTELVSFTIPQGNVLDGMMLKKMSQKLALQVLFCAVERGDETFIPSGDFTMTAGDTVYMMGAPKEIENAFRQLKARHQPARSVMIAGGGRISYYLADALCNKHIAVKIIERNKERAEELAELLPDAVILQGDAADHELLAEEGIDKTDAFIALTGLDEGNILSSMYAQKVQVPKVITKINNESLISLIRGNGLQSIVSPKTVTSNQILRYVRAVGNRTENSSMISLYKLANGIAEVSEFRATAKIEALTSIPLMQMRLKKDILIACIVRDGHPLIPHGTDFIKPGDSVLVVSRDHILRELSDILEDAE